MSNPYAIALEISLHDGASAGLAGIAQHMLGLHGAVEKLNKGFSKMHVALIGAASAMAGIGILKTVGHFEEAAEKLVHAETALAAGLPKASREIDLQIAKTSAYAEASKNLNTTLSGNVEHIHDLYNVVQDMGHAAHLLPVFNTLATAFSFVSDETAQSHGKDSKQLAMAARAFELTGRTTPEAMEHIANDYVKAVIALRGRVTGNDLFQAVSSAGAGRYGWNDDFISTGLPALINVMKGRTGTVLYHLGNNLYGGVASSKTQADYQEKWGLHSKSDEILDEKKKFKGFKVGSVWKSDELSTDPMAWANDYREFLKTQKHVNVDDMGVMRKVVGEIARGNKSLGVILDELLLPNTIRQLNKERGNIHAVGDDAMGIANKDDPKLWRQKLAAKWDDLHEAIGKPLVPLFISNVLEPLTKLFKDVSQWALANPGTVKGIGVGLTVVAAGLTAIGAVLVGGVVVSAIAAAGPFVLAIGGVAAAVVGAAALLAKSNEVHGYIGSGSKIEIAAARLREEKRKREEYEHSWRKYFWEGVPLSDWQPLSSNAGSSVWSSLKSGFNDFTKHLSQSNFSKNMTSYGSRVANSWTWLSEQSKLAYAGYRSYTDSVSHAMQSYASSGTKWASNEWTRISTGFTSGMRIFFTFIKGGLKGAWAWTKGATVEAVASIKSIGASFVSAVHALPGQVAGAISSAFASIGALISNAISGIGASIKGYMPSWLGGGVQKQSAPGGATQAPAAKAAYAVPQYPSAGRAAAQPIRFTPSHSAADGAATSRPAAPQPIIINTTVVSKLDGKTMATAVTRQQVAAARYQSSTGPQDTRGTWASPSGATGVAV